jgi:hypothetical protein
MSRPLRVDGVERISHETGDRPHPALNRHAKLVFVDGLKGFLRGLDVQMGGNNLGLLTVALGLKADGVGLAFVLDDEPKVGTVVCKVLSAIGIGARHFVAAEQFLHEVSRCNPDLVVLDLALGNTDAVEVIRQLHVLKFNGKVLLISGRDEGTLD